MSLFACSEQLVSARVTSPRLLQHQRAFLADRGREFLREHRQQPGQRDFQAHVVIGDIDEADGALAERAEIEGEPIAAPGFLMDGQQRGIVRARGGEAGLDAARRLFAAEAVRDGHDQGSGQLEPPRMREVIWGTPCVHASHTPSRSALLSDLEPAPGTARRSVDEAGTAMTAGSQRSRNQAYCGTTWTVQNLA